MLLLPASNPLPCQLPVFAYRVPAGFPSPADDYQEGEIDLNKHLIARPAATFILRSSGDSMIGEGIHDGDLLVVDRSIRPVPGNVVVAVVNGDLTIKRLARALDGTMYLEAANPMYPDIVPGEGETLDIWGVVRHAIHDLI